MKLFQRKFILLLACFVAVTVQAMPKRIISLVPSATKSINLLGGGNLIVGCTSFCERPKTGKAQVVASAVQVNLEKAMLLKPDLVIVSTLTNPETIKTFQKLGVEVMNFPYPKSYKEVCDNFVKLGAKIEKEQKAKEIVVLSQKRLAAVKARIPKQKTKPTVFMQIGANPLFTAVPNTFMDDFIVYAGCANIASDLKLGSITRETVLARNPDVIFVILMGTVSKEEKTRWMQYKNLKSVKNNKIFIVDDDKTCAPTPLLFVDALEEMVEMIY